LASAGDTPSAKHAALHGDRRFSHGRQRSQRNQQHLAYPFRHPVHPRSGILKLGVPNSAVVAVKARTLLEQKGVGYPFHHPAALQLHSCPCPRKAATVVADSIKPPMRLAEEEPSSPQQGPPPPPLRVLHWVKTQRKPGSVWSGSAGHSPAGDHESLMTLLCQHFANRPPPPKRKHRDGEFLFIWRKYTASRFSNCLTPSTTARGNEGLVYPPPPSAYLPSISPGMQGGLHAVLHQSEQRQSVSLTEVLLLPGGGGGAVGTFASMYIQNGPHG